MFKPTASSVPAVCVSCLLIFLVACGSGTSSQPVATATPVTITTSSLPSAAVGVAYSATIVVTTGVQPYTFSVTSGLIPQGFRVSSSGVLSGVPTSPGVFTFTITVADAQGQSASQSYKLTITGTGTPVSITTTSLPAGTVGSSYSAPLVAAGGTAPYTFALTTGALPAGLTLSTGGLLSGTPTAAATSSFSLTVTDAVSEQASASYTVTIAPPATSLSITTSSLPTATVGTLYNATIVAANGTTPYSFAVTTGALPAGLSLSTAGALTGTPTANGTSTFTVTVTDAASQQAAASYTLTVAALTPVSIVTPLLPGGVVGTAYNTAIYALNGVAPYSFAVTLGALPAGLVLSPAGILSGTPSTAATSSFTITVTDAHSQTASAAYSITIAPAGTSLTIVTSTLPGGTVGTAYNSAIIAANGTPSYTFLLGSGTLPAGLSFSPVGVLFGTPTTVGTYTFTVDVEDANSQQAYAPYTVVIAAAAPSLSITTASLPSATVGASYTQTIAAANGTAPYTFAESGTLPAGLALSTGGLLSGTPTSTGTYTFAVTVTDANSKQASANFTVIVAAAGAPLSLVATALPVALAGSAYSASLEASGGTAPYILMLSSGVLPTGITLSTSGVLSGTTSTTGSYTFTVTAHDSSTPQQTAPASFTLNVVTASVRVDTTTTLATVPQTFFGVHTSVYDPSLNDVARLPALLATGGISMLRYPGGSYADQYHWAQNSLTPIYSSMSPACGQISDGYLAPNTDFGSFIKTLEATGTQAVLTINYGSSVADSTATLSAGSSGVANRCSNPNAPGQPQEAAAWVAYANGAPSNTQVIGVDAAGFDWKTVGYWASMRAASPLAVDDGYNFLRIGQTAPLGVKYWEIGNELYYNGWSGNRNYEEDVHAPFIYPSGYGGSYESRNQLAALSPTAYGANSVAFIQAMKAVDPSILIGVNFASPGATDPIPLNWNPDLAESICAGTTFDLAIIHYYPGTYNAVQPSELLSLPESDLPRQIAGIKADLAQYCPANASAIKFWLTETSPNGNLAGGFPTPILGLFALNEYLVSLENGVQNIDWLELHNGTYLDESENPDPAFYGIQMAHLLAGFGDSVVSATSSSPNVLSFATVKTNGQRGVLLVNASSFSSAVVEVSVNGATLGATATEYSYGATTTQSAPALSGSTFAIPANTFPVTVPPYTAVVLLIP